MRPLGDLGLPLACVLAAACGPQVLGPSAGSTGDGSGTTGRDVSGDGPGATAAMTGAAATGAPTTTGDPIDTTGGAATFGGPGTDGNLDDSDGGDFISPPDVYCAPPSGARGSVIFTCDLFAQDCPRGSKCMPAALCDATVWNSTACTPLDPNPGQQGDPCTVQYAVTSGIDDCDIGQMCAFVDPDSLQGVCTPMCTGSEDSPICELDTEICAFAYDGVISVCLQSCDPLLDDCAPGTCVPARDAFACFPEEWRG